MFKMEEARKTLTGHIIMDTHTHPINTMPPSGIPSGLSALVNAMAQDPDSFLNSNICAEDACLYDKNTSKTQTQKPSHLVPEPDYDPQYMGRRTPAHCSPDDLYEIETYMGADSLILGLYQAYIEARAHYHKTLVDYGHDAPISEVSAEQLDQAWCVLQTRLYELRTDQAARAHAQALERYRVQIAEEKHEREQNRIRRESEFIARLMRTTQYKAQHRAEKDWFWWMMAWVFFMRFGFGTNVQYTQTRLGFCMRQVFNGVMPC